MMQSLSEFNGIISDNSIIFQIPLLNLTIFHILINIPIAKINKQNYTPFYYFIPWVLNFNNSLIKQRIKKYSLLLF